MTGVNDTIADATVGHQIGLQRYSNATVRKMLALLRRVDADIVARLARDDLSDASRKRQNALLADVRRIIDSAYADATGQLNLDLEALADYEQEWQVDLLDDSLPIEFQTETVNPDQLYAAVHSRPFQGRLLREWYKDLPDQAYARLRDSIRIGFTEGQTNDEMIRAIRATRANGYRDGILAINRRHAEATVRTAVNHTANTARGELYKKNKSLIKGAQ